MIKKEGTFAEQISHLKKQRSAFIDYINLTWLLHEAIFEKGNDSSEADEIRDKMDKPYYLLSESQVKSAGKLAEIFDTFFENLNDKYKLEGIIKNATEKMD